MEMRFMVQNAIHTRRVGGWGCNGEWHVDGSDIGFRSENRHIPSLMNGQICIHRPESPRLCQVKPQTLTFCIPKQELPWKENHRDRSAQTISQLKSEPHSSNFSEVVFFSWEKNWSYLVSSSNAIHLQSESISFWMLVPASIVPFPSLFS